MANVAPVNFVPGAQGVEANTSTPIEGLQIFDQDAGVGLLTTTLSVEHGTLTVTPDADALVVGSGTRQVVLTGTVSAINSTLAAFGNVRYQGDLDYFGHDLLTMATDDMGNTGPGGPLTDVDTVAIQNKSQFFGTPGDDSFAALPGNERVDALAGTDTIRFNFKLIEATIAYKDNTIVVDGPAGSHTVLTGFERFSFTDGTVTINDANPLVDDLFYYSRNHDVWTSGADADSHYSTSGWQEGRDPNAFFSTRLYLANNVDVALANVDPLSHFHEMGWREGRATSLTFDPREYLLVNPDVAAAGVDPLFHFLAHGAAEGRLPLAPPGELIAPNGFDYVFYLDNNPDVAAAEVNAFHHFQTFGWREGRNPNGWFDTSGYLAAYSDVEAHDVNPLDHYARHGWHEGRDPSPNFDTFDYLASNPDVAAAGVNPLVHFLQYGIYEGRSPQGDGVWG